MQLCVYVSNHEIYKTALIWLHMHGKKGNLPGFETSQTYFDLYTLHGNLDHLHRVFRTISRICRNLRNLLQEVISFHHLAKDRMCGWSGTIEPIQEAVVVHIDEELGATRVGSPGIGHGQSAWFIAQLGSKLILDVATSIAESLAILKLGPRLESNWFPIEVHCIQKKQHQNHQNKKFSGLTRAAQDLETSFSGTASASTWALGIFGIPENHHQQLSLPS